MTCPSPLAPPTRWLLLELKVNLLWFCFVRSSREKKLRHHWSSYREKANGSQWSCVSVADRSRQPHCGKHIYIVFIWAKFICCAASYQYITIISFKRVLYCDISAFRVLNHYLDRQEKISCSDWLSIMTVLKGLCRRLRTLMIWWHIAIRWGPNVKYNTCLLVKFNIFK